MIFNKTTRFLSVVIALVMTASCFVPAIAETAKGITPKHVLVESEISADTNTNVAIDVKNDSNETSVEYATELDEALNVEGGTLNFWTGVDYPFVAVLDGERYYAESTSQHEAESISNLYTSVNVSQGEVIIFDYSVGCGDGNDEFIFLINNEVVFREGESTSEWEKYAYEFPRSGEYILTWRYRKDYDRGEGFLRIDNVAVEPRIIPTNFTLDIEELDLPQGNTGTINIVYEPVNVNIATVQWTSSDEEVVYVEGDKYGATVYGVYYGEATIYCDVYVGSTHIGTKTVNIIVERNQDICEALNVYGGELEFISYGYPFVAVNDDERYYAKSTNNDMDDTESTIMTVITAEEGDFISFDYFVSSEEDYDELLFCVNDEVVWEYSGIMAEWDTFSYEIPHDGSFTCTWTYSKDFINSEGEDVACLDNIELRSCVVPTDFSFDVDELEIAQGYSGTINVNYEPSGVSGFTVEWSSSNEDIATVEGDRYTATVTAVDLGETTVSCTVYVDGESIGTKTVDIIVEYDYALAEALNVDGGELLFVKDEYPFNAASDGERDYAESTNVGVIDSQAILMTTLTAEAGDIISFDYFVSWRWRHYDIFTFSNAAIQEPLLEIRDTSTDGWETYRYIIPEDGEYTFVWKYVKSEDNDGYDVARIDNVRIISSLPGDVNGDGSLTSVDAILILRYAIHCIDEQELIIENADINCDGIINSADAVIVFRIALGITLQTNFQPLMIN